MTPGLAERVVRRFLAAGDVVNLGTRNLITIAGRKYALSTDGGPLGDRENDEGGILGDPQSGGARFIPGPTTDKWKYLWVYDTDKQVVAMWRVSDGNEKHWSTARSEAHQIQKLEKKRQLNRVDHEAFVKIEREMESRARDNERAMMEYIQDSESDMQRRVNELTLEYFDRHVRPDLVRAVDAVKSGVDPLGFKPHAPTHLERQKTTYVMGRILARIFTEPAVERFLRDNGIDLDDPGADIQAAHWAIQDVTQAAYDEYLPPR